MDHYPIIELPHLLELAQEAELPPPVEPVAIPLPVCPIPPRLVTAGLVLWGLPLLLAGLWFLRQGAEVWAGLVALAGIAAWGLARRRVGRRHAQAVDRHPAEQRRHQDYLAVRAQYEQALAAHVAARAVPQYCTPKVTAFLAAGAAPFYPMPALALPAGLAQPKKGRSEAFFLRHLQAQFGERTIFTDCRVPVAVPRLKTEWYYPDYVYRDASGLCIDIEIDEPYALGSLNPIHCRGDDDDRNAFFVCRNWVVVRFTEDQVRQHPLLCCKELAVLIFALTHRHYAARFYWERLPLHPQWDRADALLRARHRTRERGDSQTLLAAAPRFAAY